MKVDVSISLDGKRITGNVFVTEDEWQADSLKAVLESIDSQYSLKLSRFYGDRNIRVESGEVIGRLDMDLTKTLEEEPLRQASTWMDVDISNASEVNMSDTDYVAELIKTLRKTFPALDSYRPCHICHPYEADRAEPLSTLIPHLNDQHEWTIAQIADWLEELSLDIGIKHETAV